MILVKSTVQFKRFTPALVRILDALDSISRSGRALVPGMPDDLVITSANDSVHLPTSRHYRDEALDIRTHSFPNRASKDIFTMTLQARLGPCFTVLFESADTEQEHVHVQPRKGTMYP